MKQRSRIAKWWHKTTHWEYWSFTAVYAPILFYYGYLSLKARSFFFFSASNPSIENGGMLMESKWKIYKLLPSGSYPTTFRIEKDVPPEQREQMAAGVGYPCIAKPDIGGKGKGVVKLHHHEELHQYHEAIPVTYLLQELILYPKEIGLFFVRNPHTGKGHITGIVEKQFLTVTGDGTHSIAQILEAHPRYSLYTRSIQQSLAPEFWASIPAKGEMLTLVPFGNHARGAIFLDKTHKVNAALLNVFEEYCAKIQGFHFGRLDIRFQSWELLEQGQQFSVIEVNGAGSEPTHMYDPSHSILFAWKEIIRHWRWLYRISKMNRQCGIRYMSLSEGKKMLSENNAYEKQMANFHFTPVKPMSRDLLQHI